MCKSEKEAGSESTQTPSRCRNEDKGEIEGDACRNVSVMYLLVVAFSLRARILGDCLTIHSKPVLFSFLKQRLARAHYFHS